MERRNPLFEDELMGKYSYYKGFLKKKLSLISFLFSFNDERKEGKAN